MEGSFGRPGSTDRVLAVLRSRTEGQDGPRVKDGEQLLGNRLTGDDGVGAIPVMAYLISRSKSSVRF